MIAAMIERYEAYAEEIAILGGLTSNPLRQALVRVRRDRFLPPGPWVIESLEGSYYTSESADIGQILHGVGVAIDLARLLNNANPVKVCVQMQLAEIQPGQTIFHIGAGYGYFTALMAELVGPQGRVIAAEIDPGLAEIARANLAEWPQVEVVGDALAAELPMVDLIFSSAGLAEIPLSWPERLRQGGRMILPITGHHDHGAVFLFQRLSANGPLAARIQSFTRYFPCLGTRDDRSLDALTEAFKRPISAVQSLRLDQHPAGPDCWLHRDGWCLSERAP
jgi:protein-L-isoaspartate(D-aspartate) O-methyltransferase